MLTHRVPLMAYILQGEMVVSYEDIGEIRYVTGDAFVEAFNHPHHAYNGGRGVVKILTVYAGDEGVPNAILLDD